MQKDIILRLPGDMTVKDIKNLSVWCRAFSVNFGDMVFPQRVQDLDL